MKKSLIALAAVAASGAAMAQSSVTLFGVVDTGVTYIDGKDNWSGMHSGANNTSRIGFRGTEDLGGGLKANFWLEAGINTDAGDGKSGGASGTGLEFKRRSTVGLQGGFGEIRLGRELTAAYLAVSRYDVFGDVGIGGTKAFSTGATAGNYGSSVRKNNMVTYVSPSFSGFKAQLNYAFGESTQKTWERGAYYGLGLTYDNGPLSVGFGAERQNNTLLGFAANASSAADGVDSRLTTYGLGASYNFGVVKVGGFYRDAKSVNLAGASFKHKSYVLGVSAPVGAAGEVKAQYARYEVKPGSLKADQISLGYVHSLSKRTAAYGTYSYIKNKNNGALGYTLGSGGLSNGKQHGIQVGIRHAF